MSKVHQVELTEKELYLLWSIACWFGRPVTSTLKHKLSGLAFEPERDKYKHFDEPIEDQLISAGEWLKNSREQQNDYYPQ